MSDTPLVKKYIDSVDGMAHQSAIAIIINLEKKLETADNRNTRNYYADGYEAGYQAGMAEKKPWVGLTGKEISEIYNQDSLIYMPSEFYRALEAKLKDKNGG